MRACDKNGSQFLSYDTLNFTWEFKVEHFTRYGIDEESEDEKPVEEEKLMEDSNMDKESMHDESEVI